MLQKIIDLNERYRTRIIHHSGFIPLPLWKHIKIHFRLWKTGNGGTTLKHLFGEEKSRRRLRKG